MTENKRYRMEYVNCEVSAIYDDYEKEELIAEEIVDRLNQLSTKNRQLKKKIHIYETTLKESIQNERTHLGHNALKQLAENLEII